MTVILEPKSLVDSIITGVGRMRKVEVNQISTIHHTRRIEGHRGVKSHTNQPPLASITGANVMGDKEELISASDDTLNQDIGRRNFRCRVVWLGW